MKFNNSKIVLALVDFLITISLLLLILYLNYSLLRFWFEGEFNQNMASIEISYIQMAKFWAEGGTGWQPQWYLGHPFSVFYTPLLPALEVVGHWLLGFSFAHAYRVITGVGYILVPVSLFFFVWQISKSKTGAIVASLLYSFVPSVIALLFAEVAADTLSGSLEPRRFAILVRWGEGPHTLALVFVPLFGLFLSKFLENGKFRNLFFASLFFGLGALTNALVVWVMLILALAMGFAKIVSGVELTGLLKGLFALFALTFGLISFWYNIPFLTTFFREGGGALSNWAALFPWGVIVLVILCGILITFVGKVARKIEGFPFAIFWFLALFALVYTYYASGEDQLEYAPQVLRLNTEVDLAFSVLAGVVVSRIFLTIWALKGALGYAAKVVAAIAVLVPSLGLLFFGQRLIFKISEYSKPLASSSRQIEDTAEYNVSKKLEELTAGTDQRVVTPGNYGFWLNYFVDVPQIRGALFQSSTHFWPEHIYYQLTNGSDAQISLAWLKIANVGKFVFTTPASGETYHDFKIPQSKFDSILTLESETRGDVFYNVPLKNDSLAKVVDVKSHLAIGKPVNAIDQVPIFAYVESIEAKFDKKVSVSKLSDSRLRLSGEVGEGEAVLVQQTYDSGWRVQARGNQGQSGAIRGWSIKKDNLDFMVLVPKSTGSFSIDLVYGRPISVFVGYLVTAVTIAWLFNRSYKSYKSNKTNNKV